MKKIYSKPVLYTEEFALNESVANCGDTPVPLNFDCLRGPINDTENIFNEGVTNCSFVPTYYEGVNQVYTSKKSFHANSDASGVYVYCKRNGDFAPNEWTLNGQILTHKTDGKGHDTHTQEAGWHCMAVSAYSPVTEVATS